MTMETAILAMLSIVALSSALKFLMLSLDQIDLKKKITQLTNNIDQLQSQLLETQRHVLTLADRINKL